MCLNREQVHKAKLPGGADMPATAEKSSTATPHQIRQMVEAAYLAGFTASGEGWNGEYPFGDQNRSPEASLEWVVNRDRILAPLFEDPRP